jgi:hypothetical protein
MPGNSSPPPPPPLETLRPPSTPPAGAPCPPLLRDPWPRSSTAGEINLRQEQVIVLLRIATALERIAFVIDVGAAGGRLLDDLLARIRGRR